jgi:radical SAM protein with 4Fe4S-binding SPASM domain
MKTAPERQRPRFLAEEIAARADRASVLLSLTIEVTKACPARCVHCYVERETGSSREELSTGRWLELLDQAADLGCLYLTVTGGEPLVRPDIFEILGAARRSHFALRLFTTATSIDEAVAMRLAGLGLMSVEASLYSATPEVHDSVTGWPGSHKATLAGMRALMSKGIRVIAKMPVMTLNAAQVAPVFEMADREGFSVRVDPVITPTAVGSLEPVALRLDEAGLEGLFMTLAQRHEPLAALAQGPMDPPCPAGRTIAAIDAWGRLFPCIGYPEEAGDVAVEPLATVWHDSAVLRRLRTPPWPIPEDCAACGAAGYCRRCPGLTYLEAGTDGPLVGFECSLAKAINTFAAETSTPGTKVPIVVRNTRTILPSWEVESGGSAQG